MYIPIIVLNIDFEKYRCTNYREIGSDLPKNSFFGLVPVSKSMTARALKLSMKN